MSELPATFRRRHLAVPYVVLAMLGLLAGVSMVRDGRTIVWQVVGVPTVALGLLCGAIAVIRFRAEVVISVEGIRVRTGARGTLFEWSAIRSLWAAPSRSGLVGIESEFVCIEPSVSSPSRRTIRCHAVRGRATIAAFRAAVEDAGHGHLDHTAQAKEASASCHSLAESVTFSQVLRHVPRAIVRPAVFMPVAGAMIMFTAVRFGVATLTDHELGWSLVSIPVFITAPSLLWNDLLRWRKVRLRSGVRRRGVRR